MTGNRETQQVFSHCVGVTENRLKLYSYGQQTWIVSKRIGEFACKLATT